MKKQNLGIEGYSDLDAVFTNDTASWCIQLTKAKIYKLYYAKTKVQISCAVNVGQGIEQNFDLHGV